MNERPLSFAHRSFIPLLVLGLLDRLYLLFVFGFKYVGDDDGVIWAAAVDYGHGLFREPYFYGQDYAFMLEAIVAAPFTRLGIPQHILMPTVTSLLALLPFWSFAFWHRKHHRPFAALIFLAMPVLLPVEYGLMTTITRCFVPGIAPLALLPWLLDLKDRRITALLIGLVSAMAAFINPNSIVFSAAFVTWFLLSRPRTFRNAIFLSVGTLPFIGAYLAARSYCALHPERMMNILAASRLKFNGAMLIQSFSNLDQYFVWLSPLTWTVGSMIFILLVLLMIGSLIRRDRAVSIALAAALAVVLYALGLEKTHDGMMNVFFPYSRMFLALPLLLCWSLAAWRPSARVLRIAPLMLLLIAGITLMVKYTMTHEVIIAQLGAKDVPANEAPIALVDHDAHAIQQLCKAHEVQLIVGSKMMQGPISSQYRCFLYPVLEPALPPTYLYGYERRYWQRDQIADKVFDSVLVLGASMDDRTALVEALANWEDLSTTESGPLLLVHGNTLTTDSLMAKYLRIRSTP